MSSRVGFGYDVHRLEEGLDFFLGGVKIEFEKGAKGHSDADVLIHAIIDALLGAANLRDIGFQFPDTDHKYKGIDSKVLLSKTVELLLQHKYNIANIDATVCLQTPKISSYIPKMCTAMAQAMKLPENCISIKATTSEGLGFVGSEQGLAAYAVALIEKE